MKKFVLFVIVIISLLTGCSEREIVYKRIYPDTSSLEKAREQRAAEIKAAEDNTEFGHLLNSRTDPRQIQLTVKELAPESEAELFTISEYRTFALQYCWRETFEECGHGKPINLHTNTGDLAVRDEFIMTPFTAIKESKVEMIIVSDEGMTPSPDRLEVYILEKSGDLTPYPHENITENYYRFTLPKDPNTYFFVLKGIYEEYIGGVAYYNLRITVK